MIFRFIPNPELAARLNQEAEGRLEEKTRTIRDFAQCSKRIFDSRPDHVGVVRYAAFRILHQEFLGAGWFALPTILGAGRRLASMVPMLKSLKRGRA